MDPLDPLDSPDPQAFIGRREIGSEIAYPVRMAGLSALLDHDLPPWMPGSLAPGSSGDIAAHSSSVRSLG